MADLADDGRRRRFLLGLAGGCGLGVVMLLAVLVGTFVMGVLPLALRPRKATPAMELDDAIRSGDIDRVRDVLNRGVSVDTPLAVGTDGDSELPIHRAARLGNCAILDLLVDCGADPNAFGYKGATPIMTAAGSDLPRAQREVVVERLIVLGGDVNLPGSVSRTPLSQAAFGGNLDMVRALLALGADINGPDRKGNTPLHAAAWSLRWIPGDATRRTVQALLDRGADVNAKNNDGQTPRELLEQAGYWPFEPKGDAKPMESR
jgi:hypothetical protein